MIQHKLLRDDAPAGRIIYTLYIYISFAGELAARSNLAPSLNLKTNSRACEYFTRNRSKTKVDNSVVCYFISRHGNHHTRANV